MFWAIVTTSVTIKRLTEPLTNDFHIKALDKIIKESMTTRRIMRKAIEIECEKHASDFGFP